MVELGTEYAREKAARGDVYVLLAIANGLTNLCWEYGRVEEGKPWALATVSHLRSMDMGRRSDAIAFAYWKAGEPERALEECRGVIRQRLRSVAESAATDGEATRLLGLLHLDLAVAAFLCRQYELASANAADAARLVGGRPGTAAALAKLSEGVLVKEPDLWPAVRFVRGLLRHWPSLESSGIADIYRYSLVLARHLAGPIPEDLRSELLANGGEQVATPL